MQRTLIFTINYINFFVKYFCQVVKCQNLLKFTAFIAFYRFFWYSLCTMKRSELFFSAILVPLDYIALLAAGIVAYQVRYLESVRSIRPIIFDLKFSNYFFLVLLFAIIWIAIFSVQGLYTIRGVKKQIEEIGKIILACSAGIAAVMAAMFFTRYLFDSRFIVLTAWILSIFFVTFERILVRALQRKLHERGIGVHRVVFIGDGISEKNLSREFLNNKKLGYKVVYEFNEFNSQTKETLGRLADEDKFDEIIVTNPDMPKDAILELSEFSNERHLDYKYVADLLGTKVSRFEIQTHADIPIIEIKKTSLDGWGRILKRVFDIFFSLAFIIVALPIMLACAIAIKIDSDGPIFFRYKRIGERGRVINFIKFRTMIRDAHTMRYDKEFASKQKNLRVGTPMIKFENDPRITRVGRLLRRWSIDEFPQFFLALTGKMSIVGPRPHEIEEVAQYNKTQKQVLRIKPGITGLAQVSGRSDIDFDEEVRLDIFYIEDWSLMLDIQIIGKTPFAIIRRRKAL